jgi:predicted phosphodiesterase
MKKRFVLLLAALGLFAVGAFIASHSNPKDTLIKVVKEKVLTDLSRNEYSTNQGEEKTTKKIINSFAIITDIHNNIKDLHKALDQINKADVSFIIGLGDYSNVGTTTELRAVNNELKRSTKKQYLLPGDHDLWNGRDKTEDPRTYYDTIFGKGPEPFATSRVKYLFLDNADIYKGVSEEKENKFTEELQNTKESTLIILMHKPLYHPISNHKMGYINDELNEEVATQRDRLLEKIKAQNKRTYILNGDLHSFDTYTIPNTKIQGYTIGALTELKNFQTPRYAVAQITEEGELLVKDIPVE